MNLPSLNEPDDEEADDVAAFDEAMAEEGPNIPWPPIEEDVGR